jgi:hypothetical protein
MRQADSLAKYASGFTQGIPQDVFVETRETSELECSDTISFMDIDNEMTPRINWLQGDVDSIPAADRHKVSVKALRFILQPSCTKGHSVDHY